MLRVRVGGAWHAACCGAAAAAAQQAPSLSWVRHCAARPPPHARRRRKWFYLPPPPTTSHHFPAGAQIRLKGKNLTENEHVKLGAYHTLELELQRAFTLHKARQCGCVSARGEAGLPACAVPSGAPAPAWGMHPVPTRLSGPWLSSWRASLRPPDTRRLPDTRLCPGRVGFCGL